MHRVPVDAELMGRGIVHPVDDFRVSNLATNQPLLDALARDFVEHKFDLKHLIGTIMRSGVTMLLVEENFSHVHDLDARILLLESGRIVREGTVAELEADEAVMATYLGT